MNIGHIWQTQILAIRLLVDMRHVLPSIFSDLGYRFDAVVQNTKILLCIFTRWGCLKQVALLVKYTALKNYDEDQFLWQGLERESEVPDLLEYVAEKTDYPVSILEDIVNKFKAVPREQYILLIDGVEKYYSTMYALSCFK